MGEKEEPKGGNQQRSRKDPKYSEDRGKVYDENKIKQYSGNENIQIKKNQLDDIIKKYNKIKEQSVNDFKFCNVLLTKLMVEFTKRTNKTFSQETYDKVCKDIIHSQIEKFIKYNKEVINIKELLNEIKF